MLATLPSIEALAQMLGCEPTMETGPPEFGVVSYEVTYETDNDRITLQVLPWAAEIQLSVVAKNPTRIFRLALGDVAELSATEDEEGVRIDISFLREGVQPLHLSVSPVVLLIWGNQEDAPERHPPWERDDT
ncbi:hypothetical protein [Rhodoferax aquaticus]|uniref:Uncharacterized protein n=1 Tax=Rhodoferax aquaticus TaxID=2527691 RepID=A0A515EQE3_9BURK|nr:hypothetical protein [Rhodoferax aquaticus]QDL54898.1 hypothetical protein EXZ61_12400 [Rhodoferax aquaticus]